MRTHSSDPRARAGWTNDPAETDGWAAWITIGNITITASKIPGDRIRITRTRG